MKNIRYIIVLFTTTFFCSNLFGQGKLDSLEKALVNAKDTSRVRTLLRIAKENNNINPTKSISYYKEAIELSLMIPDSDCLRSSYRGMALVSLLQSDYLKGVEYAERSLKIKGKKTTPSDDADSYTLLGLCKFKLGKIEEALSIYHKALTIYQMNGDQQRTSMTMNNIGSLYYEQDRNAEALAYFLKAKKIKEEINDKKGMASLIFNIASIYTVFDSIPKSNQFYNEALNYYLLNNDSNGIAESYSGLGTNCVKSGQLDKALELKKRALLISRIVGDRAMEGHALTDIGDIYSRKGNNKIALAYLDSGLKKAIEIKNLFAQVQAYSAFANHYDDTKDPKNQLKYLRILAEVKDSLFNEENSSAISDIQSRYESEQKQSQIDLLKKDTDLQELRLKKGSTWLVILVPGLFLIVLVLFVLFGRNRAKQKANLLLKHQNELLSQQEIEIMDSIQYSLSIQQSMLPDQDYISASLKDYFILNQPKDIVSGDFYFFERTKDHLVFSAVDCTGHGVPGALLSFLGMDILRVAVRKRGLTKPADILSFLDQEVHQRLQQTSDEKSVNDGMDLALCSLNLRTKELQYAGSFNPVYIISDNELKEIKSDKHSIGSNESHQADAFNNHLVQLKKNDRVYIFSDGYADQFGGPGGKKFKYKPMQELLLQNHLKPMSEQKEILEEIHHKWKGELFQVDDILMIGLCIE